MMNLQYAIIRDDGPFQFYPHMHDSFESAKAEAERLCKKEKKSFVVFSVSRIGKCSVKEIPIEWEF
jgi:hypothetical protein